MTIPELAADTDLCVKCGLCLPHCPTYTRTLDENESPRGRLALIQGWARGALPATPRLAGHVDRCLLCRACEAVCPAQVPYGRIVDRFRQETGALGKSRSARLVSSLARQTLARPVLSRFLSHLPLEKLSFMPGAGGLPAAATKTDWIGPHRADSETGQAALFLGCTAALLDAETVASAIKLLNAFGISVRVSEGQGCCGALHWHGGDTATAVGMMKRNLAAFASPPDEAIVSFASGCGAMLRDYGEVLPDSEAGHIAGRVRDISRFLAELPWPENLELRPLKARVCLHTPCSLKNVLKSGLPPQELLRRVPGLELIPLPADTQCCGAAGSYLLEHPDLAGQIRGTVLDRIIAADAAYLATSNPGCAMHLRAGLKQRGRADIEVLHPVTVLARQMVPRGT